MLLVLGLNCGFTRIVKSLLTSKSFKWPKTVASITFKPHAGLTDADRNCISNIHSSGMEPDQAAHQLHFLLMESLRTSLGGVSLSEFMATHSEKPELD